MWDPGLLHGGPVVGLAAWAAERAVEASTDTETGAATGATTGLVCARLTVDLLRGVPAGELTVEATMVKPGRRAMVVDATIESGDRVVATARSLWLQPSGTWESTVGRPPPRPDTPADPGAGGFEYPRPGFNCDAAELRYVSGSNEASGPGVVWARLTSPLIAGIATSPLVRVATVSDLAAAAGFELGPDGEACINPDLTLQLNRLPAGEWLAIDARNHHSATGVGFNEAVLADDRGVVGRVLQSLVQNPMPPAITPEALKI